MATKGRTVGAWLRKDTVGALETALATRRGMAESTYCAEAIEDRLRREGYIKDNKTGQIAARAAELVTVVGEELVSEALDRLEQSQLSEAGVAS